MSGLVLAGSVGLVGATPKNSYGEDLSILIGASDVGVCYDRDLIGQFLVSDWVCVMVNIKDFSNIAIDYKKDSIEIQTAKDNLR